jgi:hypothetical protein
VWWSVTTPPPRTEAVREVLVPAQPAPPTPADPAFPEEVRALSQLYVLNKDLSTKALSEEYKIGTEQYLAVYLMPDARSLLNGSLNARGRVNDAEQKIKDLAKTDFDDDIDLHKHPQFDLNHNLSTPKADKIDDAELREEYRRLYNQFATGQRTIELILNKYGLAARRAEAIVRTHSGTLPK